MEDYEAELAERRSRSPAGAPAPLGREDAAVVGVAPPAEAVAPSPYEDELAERRAAREARLGASLRQAVGANPETVAKHKAIADATGIPQPVVERNEAFAANLARVQKLKEVASTSPVLARQLADPEFAKLAHDDAEGLAKVESILDSSARVLRDLGKSMQAGKENILQMGAWMGKAALDVLTVHSTTPGLDPSDSPLYKNAASLSERFRSAAKQHEVRAKEVLPQEGGFIERNIYQGVAQLPANLLGLSAAVITGNPMMALLPLSAMSGAQAYGEADEKGMPLATKLTYAASQGVIEYFTEKLPVGKLLSDLAAGTPFHKMLMKQMVAEGYTEQVATVLQDLNEWAVLKPEATLTDYLKERPTAAASTLIQTIVAVGGQTTVAKGVQMAAEQIGGRAERAAQAERERELFTALQTLATESKTRERSPEAFATFLQEAADGVDITDVYVNSAVLAQAMQQQPDLPLSKEVREQMVEATVTNADVRIPLGEYYAHIAPSPVGPLLLDNIKATEGGDTFAEATAFYEQQGDIFKAQAEEILAQENSTAEFGADAALVKQQFLDQFSSIGRFTPQVNEVNASIITNMYTVLANKMGISPTEALARYPVTLSSQSTATPTMDQPNEVELAADQIAAMPEDVRDNTEFGNLPGGYPAYRLFEARKLLPKPKDKLKKVNENNSMELSTMYDFVANVDGEHYGISKYEDPDATEDGDEIVFAYQPLKGGGRDKMIETHTADEKELFELIRASKTTLEQSVSTRVPTAKKATENALTNTLVVGLDSMKADPKAFGINVGLISKYPNFRDNKRAVSPEQKAESFIQHVTSNLLWLHDQVPPAIRERSKLWYDGARKIATDWSAQYNQLDTAIAGVLAVLSPQKDWFMNVSLAQRVLDTWTMQQDHRWDGAMTQTAARIIGKEQYAEDLKEITGKTLGELQSPVLKAMWLRVYDQTFNTRAYPVVMPEGTFGESAKNADGRESSVAWGGFNSIAKAVSILMNPDIANISANLGEEHKVRNFYNNIIDPNSANGDVTIDTHAVAAGLIRPLAGESIEVKQNFGGMGASSSSVVGSNGTYGIYAEAYRRAAAQRGILPREMQSITWEAVRGLFPPTFKSKKANVDAIDALWNNYKERKATHESTRQQVLALAGGINPPEWARSAAGAHEGAGSTVDAGELPQSGVPGGPQPGLPVGRGVGADSGRVATLAQQQGSARANITFGPDITKGANIALLQNADLSSFFHELGHLYLEVLGHIASQPNAPDALVSDMNAALKWFGVKTYADWQKMTVEQKRPHHEKFARGFEAYLFEGKSPSIEMQSMFDRVRAWLLQVYKSLTELNVELTDEVRSVFDRMLGSEAQIASTEALRSLTPAFQSADDAQATTEEWLAYLDLGREQQEDAVRTLERRSLADLKWAQNAKGRYMSALQAEAKEKRAAITTKITEEVEAQPLYRAIDFLQKVKKDAKLSLDALREMYGDKPNAPWRYFPTGKNSMVTAENGMHPDEAAELLGFTSGDDLVRQLLAAAPKASVIEGMTDQRMLERHGDLSTEQAIAHAADVAVRNDARARFVATELAFLQRIASSAQRTGQVDRKDRPLSINALARAAKAFAGQIIARKRIGSLRPAQYAAAEARAGKAAAVATDPAQKMVEKRNQLVNLQAERAARAALAEVEKGVRYLKRVEDSKTIDVEYLDQIHRITERFDIRQASQADVRRRAALAEWIEQQKELGFEPSISKDMQDEARRQHYSTLTVEEFRGLLDAVKNIEHLGRLKHKLVSGKEEREFDAAVDEAAASITANATGTAKVRSSTDRGPLVKASSISRGLLAIHRKFASIIREMDGFKANGALWNLFVRPMNAASDMEVDLNEKATKELVRILKPIWSGGGFTVLSRKAQKVSVPEVGRSFTREERIGIGLNMGNADNIERVMSGEKWTRAQLQAVVDTLSKEELDAIQAIWDFFNTYKPMIAEKIKRVSGVEPEWVEAVPLQTKHGTYKGGYYPIAYDPLRSTKAAAHEEAEMLTSRGLYVNATTRRGHLEKRVESTGRPMRYDFGSIVSSHVRQVVHDLAWHEYLIDANRLLKAPAIDGALRKHYDDKIVGQLHSQMRDIAVGELPPLDDWDKLLTHLRHGSTVVGLGWNFVTAFLQPIGLTNSMARIGVGNVAKGVWNWATDPERSVKWVHEQSSFMRHRHNTFNRSIEEIRNKVEGKDSALTNSFFYFIGAMQKVADMPTWVGEYERAMREDAEMTHETAVALADQAVRDAQGAGQLADRAAIEKGGPGRKLFTNFYTFFNATYNLAVEKHKVRKFSDPLMLPKLAADYLLLFVVPSVLVSLMKAALKGDTEDEDELTAKLLKEQAAYFLGMMIGLRELGSAVSGYTGYTGPAGARAFSEIAKLLKQVEQGEIDEAAVKAAANTAGIILHLPTGQVVRTIDGMMGLLEGKTDNPGALIVGTDKN